MDKLVVLVDDSTTVCKIVETALHREGYKVQSFLSGKAALETLCSPANEKGTLEGGIHPAPPQVRIPDLFIVDLILPQMDGFSVIRALHAQPAFRHIPIVILSRRDGILDQIRGRVAGANDYVVKPFKIVDLVAVVRGHIRCIDGACSCLVPENEPLCFSPSC